MVRPGLGAVARAGTAALLVAVLGACGDDADEPEDAADPPATSTPTPTSLDAASLDGRTYASTSVEGGELARGATVEVRFGGGTMSVWAGCNTLFGPFEVDGTTIAWSSEPAASLMACEPGLSEQDQWLTDLFRDGVEATVEGETLVLEADGTTLELTAEAPHDLSSLLGRTWTVIGTVADGAVSRLPVRTRRPRLDVGADGLARLFTGCRSGRVTVQVDGTSLVFSNATVQRGRCTGAARKTERAVLDLLDGASDNAELHEHLLVVTRGGEGLFFEIR